MLTILNRNNFSRFGIMSSLILVNPSELSPPSSLSWFSCKYKLDLIECSSSSSSFFSFLPKNSTLFSSQRAKPTIGRQVPNDCSGQYYYNLATNLIYDPNITCKLSRLRAEYTCCQEQEFLSLILMLMILILILVPVFKTHHKWDYTG